MRVRLKGINSIAKKLADGTMRTYWYAWNGGPPLRGQPGSRVCRQLQRGRGTQGHAAARQAPQRAARLSASEDFRDGLAPRTRSDYVAKIKVIEKAFGDFPLSTMTDQRTRGVFKAWRERLASSSRRQADYAWVVLARVLSWGLDRGLVAANPCARGGRLYRGSRAEKVWTAEDEAAFLERAPAHLHLPLMLALWTGQRQGDLLRLPWSAYDGKHIRLKQNKTGARVVIRVGAPLKAMLDAHQNAAPSSSPTVTASRGHRMASGHRGARRARRRRSSASLITIYAAPPSRGSHSPDAPKRRSPPSPATVSAASAPSSTRTT